MGEHRGNTMRTCALRNRLWFPLTVVGTLLVNVVHAFNPPVDTAGPLTVRIEGPEEVTQTDVPLAVRVILENRGEKRLEGTLQLGVIDRWKAEPAQPVKFTVDGKARTTQEFKVVAGKGTYSAHYPIHAWARFDLDGKPHCAHPILVVRTNLPLVPRAAGALEWKPVKAPETGALALWNVPVQRSIVAVFGEQAQTMPVGWQGSEPRTGGSMHTRQQTLAGQTRQVVAMHPPWQKGLVGTLLVEFP